MCSRFRLDGSVQALFATSITPGFRVCSGFEDHQPAMQCGHLQQCSTYNAAQGTNCRASACIAWSFGFMARVVDVALGRRRAGWPKELRIITAINESWEVLKANRHVLLDCINKYLAHNGQAQHHSTCHFFVAFLSTYVKCLGIH